MLGRGLNLRVCFLSMFSRLFLEDSGFIMIIIIIS